MKMVNLLLDESKIIYPGMSPRFTSSSIFLAGPTPRDLSVPSWRINALTILATEIKFTGIVFVPERKDWRNVDYIGQVEWEYEAMMNTTMIIFWVPRNLLMLPGFTTNVEFGFYLSQRPNHVLYGRPDKAPNTRYLDWLYQKQTGYKPKQDLHNLLKESTR